MKHRASRMARINRDQAEPSPLVQQSMGPRPTISRTLRNILVVDLIINDDTPVV
ncbi:hypothetical protein OA002_02280 [bacterium]|nr:hypothetical protein [bacterium]